MSDEFEQKLEAKSDYAGDATSVSTPDIDAVPDAEYQIKNFIIHIAGGLHMFFRKTQNTLEFNMLLRQ